jgi:hypothetical protein
MMRKKAPPEPEPLTIVVTDLIDSGLITAPTTIFGTHSGKRVEVLLTLDGKFVHRGNTYSSPSVAAGRAITDQFGASTAGRSYASINGWKFWQLECPDGKIRTLADLRDQLLACRITQIISKIDRVFYTWPPSPSPLRSKSLPTALGRRPLLAVAR